MARLDAHDRLADDRLGHPVGSLAQHSELHRVTIDSHERRSQAVVGSSGHAQITERHTAARRPGVKPKLMDLLLGEGERVRLRRGQCGLISLCLAFSR